MDGRTDRSKKKEKELWKESTQGSDKQKGMDSRGGDRMGKQNQEDILSKRKQKECKEKKKLKKGGEFIGNNEEGQAERWQGEGLGRRKVGKHMVHKKRNRDTT